MKGSICSIKFAKHWQNDVNVADGNLLYYTQHIIHMKDLKKKSLQILVVSILEQKNYILHILHRNNLLPFLGMSHLLNIP